MTLLAPDVNVTDLDADLDAELDAGRDLDLDRRWTDVCSALSLLPDRGVCALVDGEQVAVFRLSSDEVYALSNRDPWSGANVLSRGLVGSIGDRTVVASPMYKQHVDLVTGEGVEHPDVRVPVWTARVTGGRVQVGRRAEVGGR